MRDTAELAQIALPVFSYGHCPVGGVVFVTAGQAGEVLAAARQIGEVERDQARKIQAGETLRQQTAFSEYLARRAAEPSYTFRQHLRRIGGAIEE